MSYVTIVGNAPATYFSISSEMTFSVNFVILETTNIKEHTRTKSLLVWIYFNLSPDCLSTTAIIDN